VSGYRPNRKVLLKKSRDVLGVFGIPIEAPPHRVPDPFLDARFPPKPAFEARLEETSHLENREISSIVVASESMKYDERENFFGYRRILHFGDHHHQTPCE
jgi:hypothetical protein